MNVNIAYRGMSYELVTLDVGPLSTPTEVLQAIGSDPNFPAEYSDIRNWIVKVGEAGITVHPPVVYGN